MTERAAGGSWGAMAGLVVGVAAILALIVTAFAWPNVKSAPHEVPVALAAPQPVVGQVRAQLEDAAGPETFDIATVVDRDAAVVLIENREAYGAIVVGQTGGEVLTASAASPAVAQLLAQVAGGVPAQAGGPFPVIDVVPLPDDDPRGVGLAVGLLPLVMGGMIAGVGLALRVSSVGPRVVGLVLAASAGGLTAAAVLQLWLGSLDGSYWVNAAVLALLLGAVAATILGLHRILGRPGIGVGVAIMILLGNPLAGVTTAPEMLPEGWGTLGQLLPPGAGGTALRSVAFFDGAGADQALLVLAGWLVAGLVLAVVPVRRRAGALAARSATSREPVPA